MSPPPLNEAIMAKKSWPQSQKFQELREGTFIGCFG